VRVGSATGMRFCGRSLTALRQCRVAERSPSLPPYPSGPESIVVEVAVGWL
jgi:hypothetical protein